MNKKKNNKGFSLIELIIAIAILIILTGLLAPQFMKYIEKSRMAKDMQTLDTVYSAVQAAVSDEEAYQDLVGKMAASGSKISEDEGVTLVSLMAGTDADDYFDAELRDLLGKTAADINKSFQSKLAKKLGDSSQVYVAIDKDMQIVVTYGTNASTPATEGENSLTIGTANLTT